MVRSSSASTSHNMDNPPKHGGQLTVEQLRDVQDALRGGPLAGKQVMVPIGKRALVPGRLRPAVVLQNDDDNHLQQPQEMIQLRNAATDELMSTTTTQAIHILQQEISAALRSNNKKKTPPPPPPPATTTSRNLPPKTFDTAPPPSSTTTTHSASPQKQQPTFFEIREELDNTGKEVHAEAVNISNHLHLWEQQVRQQTATTAESTTWRREPDESTSTSSGGMAEPTTQQQRQISDEAYANLTARLEELARLEEEQNEHGETTKASSQKKSPSKRTSRSSSSGWTKGFLNAESPKNKPPPSKQPVVPKVPSTSRRAQDGDGTSKQPITATESTTRWNDPVVPLPVQEQSSLKTVSFHSSAPDVREIPLIGQRSAKELKRPAALEAGAVKESVVVAERVRERPLGKHKNGTPAGPTAALPTASANADGGNNNSHPSQKKKLSRFAQQRLGQL